jgi:hypothetical protein
MEVNARLEDLLKAARSAHESAVLLRHTSHKITGLDDLKLHTTFMRAEAERVTFMIDELMWLAKRDEIMADFIQAKMRFLSWGSRRLKKDRELSNENDARRNRKSQSLHLPNARANSRYVER